MGKKIQIVGTGPGDISYTTPLALDAIQKAEVLVGAQRLLVTFARPEQLQIPIAKDLKKVVKIINEQRQNKKVVVMVTGDTGVFSFAGYLGKYIDPENLEYIPGISSIQLMFARLKRNWNDVQIFSMHGRNDELLVQNIKNSKISALLTGEPWTVQKISRFLVENGVEDLAVALGKDLSYPHEKVIFSNLINLSRDDNDYSNSVMVIFNG